MLLLDIELFYIFIMSIGYSSIAYLSLTDTNCFLFLFWTLWYRLTRGALSFAFQNSKSCIRTANLTSEAKSSKFT